MLGWERTGKVQTAVQRRQAEDCPFGLHVAQGRDFTQLLRLWAPRDVPQTNVTLWRKSEVCTMSPAVFMLSPKCCLLLSDTFDSALILPVNCVQCTSDELGCFLHYEPFITAPLLSRYRPKGLGCGLVWHEGWFALSLPSAQ